MNYRAYVAAREDREPELKAAREAMRPLFEAHRALIGARLDAGLTQQELAERLGTTQSAVARWESGSTMPSLMTLRRVAEALDVEFVISRHEMLKCRPRNESASEEWVASELSPGQALSPSNSAPAQ